MTAKKSKDIDILRSAIGQNIGFSDEQLEKGRVAVSGELKRYNKLKRRFEVGQLIRYTGQRPVVEMAMVVDVPSVADHGHNARGYYGRASKSIRVPVIVDGNLVFAQEAHIHKYTKKELKALGAI